MQPEVKHELLREKSCSLTVVVLVVVTPSAVLYLHRVWTVEYVVFEYGHTIEIELGNNALHLPIREFDRYWCRNAQLFSKSLQSLQSLPRPVVSRTEDWAGISELSLQRIRLDKRITESDDRMCWSFDFCYLKADERCVKELPQRTGTEELFSRRIPRATFHLRRRSYMPLTMSPLSYIN